jgi:hypothetical protein
MRKVFLLTGFNNWGKSRLIYALFNTKSIRYDRLYHYAEADKVDFCVQPQSNDDFCRIRYEEDMENRLKELQKAGKKPNHIFAAFCPTKEPNNDSTDIINKLYHKDKVHVIAIKYKWCLHAELMIPEIKSCYADLKNVTVHVLNEKTKDINKKRDELVSLLRPLLQ